MPLRAACSGWMSLLRRRIAIPVVGMVCCGSAEGATAPLPPPRPAELGQPSAAPPRPHENKQQAVEPTEPSEALSCLDELRAAGVDAEAELPPSSANVACVIEMPVRLKTVRPRSGAPVRFADQPIVACEFAKPLTHWVGQLVAPLLGASLGGELKAVRSGPGYVCRNRNSAKEGKLSGHATGIAIDLSGFEMQDGRTLAIKPGKDGEIASALQLVRSAACGWFTTILGPGSDTAHTDHLHLDIERHGSTDRYRICQ
jgi:hypothetical protein